MRFYFCDETTSTNDEVKQLAADSEAKDTIVVWTGYQTAGRGQKGNSWESERGKNLLCSILIYPEAIEARKQFIISEAISLAIVDVLNSCQDGFRIKWPNDIYYEDKKICGILIENRLTGKEIRECVIGIGLNLNQKHFVSNAPNPVSLSQITGGTYDCEEIMRLITAQLLWYLQSPVARNGLHEKYLANLYRQKDMHLYADKHGTFMAEIVDVKPDGMLILRDESCAIREYAFKEVSFIIDYR